MYVGFIVYESCKQKRWEMDTKDTYDKARHGEQSNAPVSISNVRQRARDPKQTESHSEQQAVFKWQNEGNEQN